MSELREMRKSVERKHNARFQPDTFGFDAERVKVLYEAMDGMGDDCTLLVKLGLSERGEPEAWLVLKDGGEVVYVGDFSWTCPPRPPEDCEA